MWAPRRYARPPGHRPHLTSGRHSVYLPASRHRAAYALLVQLGSSSRFASTQYQPHLLSCAGLLQAGLLTITTRPSRRAWIAPQWHEWYSWPSSAIASQLQRRHTATARVTAPPYVLGRGGAPGSSRLSPAHRIKPGRSALREEGPDSPAHIGIITPKQCAFVARLSQRDHRSSRPRMLAAPGSAGGTWSPGASRAPPPPLPVSASAPSTACG